MRHWCLCRNKVSLRSFFFLLETRTVSALSPRLGSHCTEVWCSYAETVSLWLFFSQWCLNCDCVWGSGHQVWDCEWNESQDCDNHSHYSSFSLCQDYRDIHMRTSLLVSQRTVSPEVLVVPSEITVILFIRNLNLKVMRRISEICRDSVLIRSCRLVRDFSFLHLIPIRKFKEKCECSASFLR